MPLIVNGTSMTTNSSGPMTKYGLRGKVDTDRPAHEPDRKHAKDLDEERQGEHPGQERV